MARPTPILILLLSSAAVCQAKIKSSRRGEVQSQPPVATTDETKVGIRSQGNHLTSTTSRLLESFPLVMLSFDGINKRYLQQKQAVCDAADLLDDDFFDTVGGTQALQTECTCRDDEPDFLEEDFASQLIQQAVDSGEDNSVLQGLVGSVNDALSNFAFVSEFDCTNGCTTCADGVQDGNVCTVTKKKSARTLTGGLTQNFTLADLAGLLASNSPETEINIVLNERVVLFDVSVLDGTCATGKLGTFCIDSMFSFQSGDGIPFQELDVSLLEDAAVSCIASVNGTECASCTIDVDEGCSDVDCTNVLPGASFSKCAEDLTVESFPGPLSYFYYSALVENQTFSFGSCDVDFPPSSPTVTTGEPSISPMTLSPVTMAPVPTDTDNSSPMSTGSPQTEPPPTSDAHPKSVISWVTFAVVAIGSVVFM